MVAGELSGDAHGGALLTHLKKSLPDLYAVGIGGSRMLEAGLDQIKPIGRLQATGLVEVLRSLPRHFRYLKTIKTYLDENRPDALLLIDYPGLNLKIAKAAKDRGIPVIYYSGPQLWAWRGGRMKQVVAGVDKMIVLFPFEVPIYEKAGVDVSFLGHPLVGVEAGKKEVAALRERAELTSGQPVVAIMPGSRPGELEKNLPPMLEGLKLIEQSGYIANYIIPVAPTLSRVQVEEHIANSGVPVKVLEGAFLPCLKIADLAIVASGTATMQVGLAGVPFVVVYRVAAITYQIAKRFAYVDYLSIVNILAGREVVPEIVQNDFTPKKLRDVFLTIAQSTERQNQIKKNLGDVAAQLGEPGAYERAAKLIADLLKKTIT